MAWWKWPNKFLLLCLALLGEHAGAQPLCTEVVPAARQACLKQWSVLIYMNGDNDLAPYTFSDLREMAGVGSSLEVDIVVQQDTDRDDGSHRYHVQRAENFAAMHEQSHLATLPEQDSGDLQTLVDFLAFGVKNFPSQHYMVIIWSHGTGYAGGISPDYSSASQLTLAQLNTALEYLQYGHLGGRKVDIYASDACLMQSLEVIYALRQRARYIIGSANREQKQGWPYREILQYLVRHPRRVQLVQASGAGADAVYWLANEIPHLYLRYYYDRDQWATMNSVVATEVARRDYQSLQQSLQRLSHALRIFVRQDPLMHPLQVLAAANNAYQFAPANRDVRTFLAQLQTLTPRGSDVYRASVEVQAAVAQLVLRPAASDPQKHERYFYSRGFGYGTMSSGLTLWLPASREEFLATHHTFAQTPLLTETGWYQLQEELFGHSP